MTIFRWSFFFHLSYRSVFCDSKLTISRMYVGARTRTEACFEHAAAEERRRIRSHPVTPTPCYTTQEMKTLKFEHELALQILAGEKTSTWRLFDDKDLSVNDYVKLIDKAEPGRPETWKAIGTARINTIIQKRLGDIEPEDYEGHERFSSKRELLKTYQKYYGSDVNYDTIVKIIRFSLNND